MSMEKKKVEGHNKKKRRTDACPYKKNSGRTKKKKDDGRMHVHEKVDGRTKKKKKRNGRMHVHEKKYNGTTKKINKWTWMHVHEKKNILDRQKKRKKKIDDEVTLSHVGKSIP